MLFKTKADFICKTLEDDIVRGKLLHGTPLEELGIAERFQCSRTPVREALHQLVTFELAERRPHHGVVVSTMPLERMLLYFEAIAEMEALCTRLCIERTSAIEKMKIADKHAEMTEVVLQKDGSKFAELNKEFHKLIFDGAKNEVLTEMNMQAQRRISPYRQVQFEDIERIKQSHLEHGLIVEAIEKRDTAKGFKIMFDHIIASQDSTLALLKKMSAVTA